MRATLAMALHFHQPVGNFDSVIERASDKCYIPFLLMLKKYPSIKMTLHFTGCLLEWAEKNRPEILKMVRDMAVSGQVEIMTGGFYEPILISIPEADRIRQIKMLSEYVKEKFSYEPEGAWVAERVWEPELAGTFNDAGVKYIVLDDTHFLYAGLSRDAIGGYFLTEDNGKTVAVFPSDKGLRYHIPYKMPSECMGYIKYIAGTKDDPLLVYGDDGEKFGEWPGTHKWVFEEKWLENFFDELVKNSDWLGTKKLSDCLRSRKSEGRIYLPTSSYEEMLEWSLPADTQECMQNVMAEIKGMGKEDYYKPFIRGGFWRNFFTKYPESNHMNKKMVHVSKKLESLRSGSPDIAASSNFREAERELFRGQCNCAYWHGVFGGLYLFHLRNAIYEHLIRSEELIDSLRFGKKDHCELYEADIDARGASDVVLENRKISVIISPSEGGAIKEIDSRIFYQNYINSLSRKKEAYHRTILQKINDQAVSDGQVKTIHDGIQTADAKLKDHMRYDPYPRYSAIDHFLSSDTDINSFASCRYKENADFAFGDFSFSLRKDVSGITLFMSKDGHVDGKVFLIEKSINLSKKSSCIKIDYLLQNKSEKTVDTYFAPEFNFTMRYADSDRYRISFGESQMYRLSDNAESVSTDKICIKDNESDEAITLLFEKSCKAWHFPVRTVSQSEKEYELNYQCSAVVPIWKFSIRSGEKKEVSMEIKIGS
ncbi:MAG: alpha-amylase/4-alpha-glucanotransferase domain-containing protein [Candidatus Omnitrophota bacterium]